MKALPSLTLVSDNIAPSYKFFIKIPVELICIALFLVRLLQEYLFTVKVCFHLTRANIKNTLLLLFFVNVYLPFPECISTHNGNNSKYYFSIKYKLSGDKQINEK
jgi:hypothetical protein